jgi:membrane associated rhomboid family serine protease
MFPLYDDVPSRRIPVVTIAIIVMNCVVFIWSQSLQPIRQDALAYKWGFVPARIGQLVTHRPILVEIGQSEAAIWPWGIAPRQVIVLEPRPVEIALTLATCLFLHGGWMHLLGNMWFLWLFGDNVEDRLGHALYLAFYLLGGLAATLTQWIVFPNSEFPVIGASGAIAAVLGAYAITWPWARVYTLVFLVVFVTIVQLPALIVLGGWFLVQILSGIAGPHGQAVQSVAWWAHIGGFVMGALLMPVLNDVLGERRHTS